MDLQINNAIKELMGKNDVRITNQRKRVLEILIENRDKHISVEEIYSLSKKKGNVIALPTIYRTMDILERIGTVIKHDFGDGAAKYEFFMKEEENHHHLICEKCGKIIEISNALQDDLDERISNENGFLCEKKQLKIYGYCKECINVLNE